MLYKYLIFNSILLVAVMVSNPIAQSTLHIPVSIKDRLIISKNDFIGTQIVKKQFVCLFVLIWYLNGQ